MRVGTHAAVFAYFPHLAPGWGGAHTIQQDPIWKELLSEKQAEQGMKYERINGL